VVWPEKDAQAGRDELLKLDREFWSPVDAQIFAEVMVGRRSAGILACWLFGDKGLGAIPITLLDREGPPDFWLNDDKGSDMSSSPSTFQPQHRPTPSSR
jgi:hypothetical protein